MPYISGYTIGNPDTPVVLISISYITNEDREHQSSPQKEILYDHEPLSPSGVAELIQVPSDLSFPTESLIWPGRRLAGRKRSW